MNNDIVLLLLIVFALFDKAVEVTEDKFFFKPIFNLLFLNLDFTIGLWLLVLEIVFIFYLNLIFNNLKVFQLTAF